MNLLLKAATIIDAQSDYHGQTVDLRIAKGIITEIGSLGAKKGETVIERDALHVSPGWFDSSVSFGEPGYEERETLAHGLEVAAQSGFTGIALNPNTNPVIDSSADILFVKNRAGDTATSVYPIGALTVKSEGDHLAELYDMQQAGAVAFGDYKKSIANPNLIKVALQYAQGFNGLVLSFPLQKDIKGKGMVHEGSVSTHLGLKGIPAIAESLQVAQDVHILAYTGGKLHIPTISCASSVAAIREAKAKGLDVSCSVAVHNLLLTDATLEDFDTRFKLSPPLRGETDREALIQGVKDGTIDMVTSDHCPIDIEGKKLEFDHAAYGTIGLEMAFQALQTVVSTKRAVHLLTAGRKRFTGQEYSIKEGNRAELSLFTDKGSVRFRESDIRSKSKNCAYTGGKGKGAVYGIIANNKVVLHDI